MNDLSPFPGNNISPAKPTSQSASQSASQPKILKDSLVRIIARDIALGIPIADIAPLRGLSEDDILKLSSGKLFQRSVAQMQEKMDEDLLQAEREDPVATLLRSSAQRAAIRLGEEVDNIDSEQGASASTRIKAADTILTKLGYGRETATQNVAVIMLSDTKLHSVRTADAALLESVPDMVDG